MQLQEQEEWTFYTSTFRISKDTDLANLLKCACDFWGLNDVSYRLYNDIPE
jgi:hypothetical protein